MTQSAAVSGWLSGEEVLNSRFRLESFCSVYQAELAAILKALDILIKKRSFSGANILSDSRLALECLANPSALHLLAANVQDKIEEIDWQTVGFTCFG